jgi:hypothetical protein
LPTVITQLPSLLPAPGVDVDQAFVFSRLTPEINTARRTDHDTRYKVSWGPLAASLAAATTPQGSNGLVGFSGPAALQSLPLPTQRRLTALVTAEAAVSLMAVGPHSRRIPSQPILGALFENTPVFLQGLGSPSTAHVLASTLGASGLSPLSTAPSALSHVTPASLGWVSLAAFEKSIHRPILLSKAEVLGQPAVGLDAQTPTRQGYGTIRTEIGSIRRLRVTRGVYLPADLPIHGIFSSKDVIHSWAIPGLCVKVDCIPGYSSHRRLFFR